MHKPQRGVTLIELMTVLVVVAIIASIAIPSYRRYLLRTQRSDAKAALLQAQTAEEKFALQANAYTTAITTNPPGGLGLTGTSENGFYTITVSSLTNLDGSNGYTLRAVPSAVTGGQRDDTDCAVFQLDAAGKRAAANSGGTDNSTNCWK